MLSSEAPTRRSQKFKILCLHGIGTNSDVLEAQTASLRYRLGDDYEYDFINGGHTWPAALGITEAFGAQEECYSYFDGTPCSALAAVDDLAAYTIENGPFHGILGFSMGSALAATLLLRPIHDDKPTHVLARSMLRSAIFVCGTLPVDRDELQRGEMGWLKAEQVGDEAGLWSSVGIPTVHAWSPQDVEQPGQSSQLVRMCKEDGRNELLHSAGHGFPSRVDEVAALAEAVRVMMTSLAVN